MLNFSSKMSGVRESIINNTILIHVIKSKCISFPREIPQIRRNVYKQVHEVGNHLQLVVLI